MAAEQRMTHEFGKRVPIVDKTDVLVLGAGPAGFSAAISSARQGARTILVEQHGFPGGMATAGLVGPFMTCYDAKAQRQIITGVFDELVKRLEAVGGAIHPSKVGPGTSYSGFITKGHSNVTPFDPEAMKMVMLEMLQESGVELLLHTRFIDTIMSGEHLDGVILHAKSGLFALKADVVVDCTGDGDVAVSAGCPSVLGRAHDQFMQPATMVFRIYNVDSDRVKAYIHENREKIGRPFHGPFSWLVEEARARGEWEIQRSEIGMYETSTPGVWRINTTRVTGINGASGEDLTRAELEGRKQVQVVLDFLRRNVPGCEDAQLMDTAAVIGIRETRHIIGDYVVTKEDLLNGVLFDDAIMIAANSMDIHSDQAGGGEYVSIDKDWYSIPFRALLPLNSKNLLIAGRAISATSEAASAFRVMPCCMAMGQAAGTAAALAVQRGLTLRQIDTKQLRELLIEQGVTLN